jgi:hypothetical protein
MKAKIFLSVIPCPSNIAFLTTKAISTLCKSEVCTLLFFFFKKKKKSVEKTLNRTQPNLKPRYGKSRDFWSCFYLLLSMPKPKVAETCFCNFVRLLTF